MDTRDAELSDGHWLRRLVRPWLAFQFPHAAQDRDTAPPVLRRGKKWVRRRAAVIQFRVLGVGIVEHDKADKSRIFRGKKAAEGDDVFVFLVAAAGAAFCAVPVLPEMVKPGTAASAAVPRLLTTPRKRGAICAAVSGEITCLTTVGFRSPIALPLSSMIVLTIRGVNELAAIRNRRHGQRPFGAE